jgi:predicted transcriptional regulator
LAKLNKLTFLPRRNACWLISGTMWMIGEKIMNEVTIGVASRNTLSARFIEAFETGKPQTASINFENERLLWQTLTLERWDILKALTGREPMTMCDLARRVERDEKMVLADMEILLNTGLLEKAGETKFVFPYDAIHVDFVLKAA